MIENYNIPFWIYLAVVSLFVGGAMKKILACHLSVGPTLVAWLGATVLVERLWVVCLPAMLLLVLLAAMGCIYSRSRTAQLPNLPAQGKAVFITGKRSPPPFTLRCAGNLNKESLVDVTDPHGGCFLSNPLGEHMWGGAWMKRLWGLVNNAGVCVNFGEAELSLMSTFRGCMEVNFFGTVDVTKSFLPLVRQAKGRIVNISSPAGDQPFPCLAAYGASKAALNLFTETLRHELNPWGVRVSTILPSSYKTATSTNHAYWEQQHKLLLQSLSPALLEEYGEDYMTETKDLFHSFSEHANPDLSPVINTIVKALLSPQPQARYYAGPGIGLMYFIHSYCPFSISNRFLQKLFLKKSLVPRALRKQSGLDMNLGLHNNNNEEKLQQL
uniref:11-beta-hydroxysteroid dehydrogenase type 2 n=2 Tax=Cyprinodon variegatus TaxID=28743 RepID=A0A3Q2C8Z7_CYPVA